MRPKLRPLPLTLALLAAIAPELAALEVTDYSSAGNDRFSSGFPTSPVENTAPDFVALGYDLSGVAWTDGFARKGYAFVSPKHYMGARHFGGDSTIVAWTRESVLASRSQQSFEHTLYGEIVNADGNGDISIGTLTEPMSAIRRYGLLDLHEQTESNSEDNYADLPLLIYGHGGSETASTRIASTQIATDLLMNTSIKVSGQQSRFLTTRDDVQLVTFDSGSPAFAHWTNPDGQPELALVGNHAGIYGNYNFHNFFGSLEVFNALNGFMNDDGHALRLVGNPEHTWAGSSTQIIGDATAWGYGGLPPRIEDYYLLFDPAQSSSASVSVDSDFFARGIYFKHSEATGDGFDFGGNGPLTVGRGGLTVYDADEQSFTTQLVLGAPQYWSIESGSVSLAALDTGGHLLEIGGDGHTRITGDVSGNGSLALSGGALTLAGASTFTGTTWVHAGTLSVSGDNSSSARLAMDRFGTLAGSGTVPAIEGSGTIAPGDSPGILSSASIDPAGGLDFDFEYTLTGGPDFSNSGASRNDLLRLTGPEPFAGALTGGNRIRLFLNVASLSENQVYDGGFFTDADSDFLDVVSGADYQVYLADVEGALHYNGQNYTLVSGGTYRFELSTVLQAANFGSGSVNGRILRVTVLPNTDDFDGWKLSHGLSGAAAQDDADEDQDGIPLLLEFALGGDPTSHDTERQPRLSVTEDGGNDYLELRLTRPQGLLNLQYLPQTTDDLRSWPSDSSGIADPAPPPIDNQDGTETLVFRRSPPISDSGQAFIRVQINKTDP